jgi:hypothetical protein
MDEILVDAGHFALSLHSVHVNHVGLQSTEDLCTGGPTQGTYIGKVRVRGHGLL